jgi:hypothetical protein
MLRTDRRLIKTAKTEESDDSSPIGQKEIVACEAGPIQPDGKDLPETTGIPGDAGCHRDSGNSFQCAAAFRQALAALRL